MPDPLAVHPRSDADGASTLKRLRLSAGLLWPVSSPPIQNGALLVGRDGRIERVGPENDVPKPAGYTRLDLGGGVLLPGLVNVHTHLELTRFAGQVVDPDFFEWIQHIRRVKATTTAEQFVDSARDGVKEMWAHGITTVADTGDTGAAAVALKELGGRAVVYQEVFGPHPDQAGESFAGLVAALERLRPMADEMLRVGVSPHAPYTVSEPLYRRVAAFARSERLPVAVHLAESPAETEFVTAGKGPFAEFWKRRGIPPLAPRRSPVAYLEECGVLGPHTLVIHAVQTDDRDRLTLRDTRCSLALCPRSNQQHKHGVPPIADYLLLKIPAGLGTDSRASVASASLLDEARMAHQVSGCSAEDLLRLLTLGGAEALGLGSEIGSLEPGKWADMVHLAADETQPLEVIIGGFTAVTRTWVAGREVFTRG